jgi:hypothetical protein
MEDFKMMNEHEEYLKKEKPYYYKLLKLKEEGEILSFENISFDGLKTLWWYETLTDKCIAELFDLDTHRTVTYKRDKWNITTSACTLMDKIKEITGGI